MSYIYSIEVRKKDKDNIVKEIAVNHQLEYYKDSDLHDITDKTSREKEINNYIYEQNYETYFFVFL